MRINAKRALTKQMNRIRQSLAEDELKSYDGEVRKLKDLFKEFTVTWEEYHDTLATEAEVKDSDSYFSKEQDCYIKILEMVTARRQILRQSDGEPESCVTKELLSVFCLPKVELEVYMGDPLRYHHFMKSFDLNVEDVCSDSNVKLTRLVQYTGGAAKEAIRGCLLISGDKGYQRVRAILESRFGNSHLVTEQIVHELRAGKQDRLGRYSN